MTTLAGAAGLSGNADGTGSNARFNEIAGLAIDAGGNLFAVDTLSHVVRKITPAGLVTTLAGQAGSFGSTNGVGSAARFNSPFGIAADRQGVPFPFVLAPQRGALPGLPGVPPCFSRPMPGKRAV